MTSRTIFFLLLFSLISCGADASFNKGGNSMASSETAAYEMSNEGHIIDQTEASPPPSEKKQETEEPEEPGQELILLRQAHCRIEVENMDHELNRIQFVVTAFQGYVSDLSIENNYWQKDATFNLRVPSKHFQSTLDSIKSFAKKVVYQRISTQDVTEEYVDISSRLETKKQVRDRYVDILRNKAKTVEEILMAEEKIRHLQEEIESREGRLRYLRDRSSMSVITVELFQELDPKEDEEDKESWISKFLADAGDSLGLGGQLIRGITLGLMAIWPLLIIFGLLFWRRKAIRARWFSRKNK